MQQHEAVALRRLEHVRCPGDVPGVVSSKDGEQEADGVANILEATEHVDRYRDDITGFQDDLRCLGVFAEMERPATRVHHEHFRRLVAVLRVDAIGRLSGAADIEAVGNVDVDVLVRAFGNTRANDGEVLLPLAPGRARVDKGCRAGNEIRVADEASV